MTHPFGTVRWSRPDFPRCAAEPRAEATRPAIPALLGSGGLVDTGPVHTDTAYRHDHVASATVWFLRGRLTFNEGPQAAPLPSALVVWGASPEEVAAIDDVPGRRAS